MNTQPVSSATAKLARLRAPRGGLTVGDRFYRGGVYLPESARPTLEATASRAARASVGSPVTIGINGFAYRVESIPVAPSIGTAAFVVIPTDRPGESHHVHHNHAGATVCTCGDYVFRKADQGIDCKHGRALAELGLMPSTMPRVLPPFANRTRRFEPTPDHFREAGQVLGWY